MALKGIIFDLDGTLADTLPICIEAYMRVFRKHLEREFNADEIVAMFGLPEEGILARWISNDLDGALNDYIAEYSELHGAITEPFPGIMDALKKLQASGLRLGMVTGKGPGTAIISLQRLGLEPYLHPVRYGDPNKPNKPEGITEVLAAWGVEPHEAAYLGDAPADMEAALQVGVHALGAAWADTTTVSNGHKDGNIQVFRTVSGFMDWVESQS